MKNRIIRGLSIAMLFLMTVSCGSGDKPNTNGDDKDLFRNEKGRFEVKFKGRPSIENRQVETQTAKVPMYAFYEQPDSLTLFRFHIAMFQKRKCSKRPKPHFMIWQQVSA